MLIFPYAKTNRKIEAKNSQKFFKKIQKYFFRFSLIASYFF